MAMTKFQFSIRYKMIFMFRLCLIAKSIESILLLFTISYKKKHLIRKLCLIFGMWYWIMCEKFESLKVLLRNTQIVPIVHSFFFFLLLKWFWCFCLKNNMKMMIKLWRNIKSEREREKQRRYTRRLFMYSNQISMRIRIRDGKKEMRKEKKGTFKHFYSVTSRAVAWVVRLLLSLLINHHHSILVKTWIE